MALNRPKLAVFFSLFRKVVLVLPLTILLPYSRLGVRGVFWAEMISQLVGAGICFGTMRVLIWRDLKRKEKEMAQA